jgi:selenocysteine lyase/cysteine desulfurase
MHRRDFLGKTAGLAGSVLLPEGLGAYYSLPVQPNGEEPEKNEGYWDQIRQLYPRPDGYINLENGYFSHQPLPVLEFHRQKERDLNIRNSWVMRKEQTAIIENSRKELALFLGCDAEELALTRNTTESLNTVIMGYPWKKGDEVVIGNQDYGSMVEAFKQAANRFGIKLREASVPLHPESDEQVVNAYSSLFTSKTKMVHITHLINLTGQVVPVAAIAAAARKKGILSAVDSAHAVAHIQFGIGDLQADFVGASLHKWLCNALGAGFLWMKKEHIEKIWPLMGDTGLPKTNIRRFEHQGTRPIHTIESIGEALRFHLKIGSELKEKRLRYLMQYWTEKAAELPKVKLLTPHKDNKRCCAIANIAVDGYSPDELSKVLYDKFKIFTVAINHPVVNGVRITPHLSSSLSDLDSLVSALKQL